MFRSLVAQRATFLRNGASSVSRVSPLPFVRFASDLSVSSRSATTELEKQDFLTQRQIQISKEVIQLKRVKPISPSLRWWRKPIYPYLWKGKPYKPLTKTRVGKSGRNNTGKITVRHRGGGHQRRIRMIDYSRNEPGAQVVERIEYDPNRTSHIALLKHKVTGKLSYIIACDGLRAGDEVESYRAGIPSALIKEMGGTIDPALLSVKLTRKGNCLPISMIPIGTIIHNIGEHTNGPAKYCRAAGAYGRLLTKIPEKGKAIIALKSGEQRYISIEACATLGTTSNAAHNSESWGKAGRSRRRGIRPTVRGVAMNKCDHPHGGGRGKSKSNKLSQSPWGVLAKGGFKTRRGKHANKMKFKDRPRGKNAKKGI